MQTKTKNVQIDKLHPEIRNRIDVLDIVMKQYSGKEAVITSGHEGYQGDGVHGKPPTWKSYHYLIDSKKNILREFGQAIDVRSRDVIPPNIEDCLRSLRVIFPGHLFDVLYETNHFHIEFDPEVP